MPGLFAPARFPHGNKGKTCLARPVSLGSEDQASPGELSTVELVADELGVHPSSVTRLCDRLTNKGLLVRAPHPESRREVVLSLTPAGRRVVDEVSASRRRDIRRIVSRVPRDLRPGLVQALQAFADAAGEVPEQSWSMGWQSKGEQT